MIIVYILLGIVGVALLVCGVVFLTFLNLWIQTKASGVRLGLLQMLMMRLRHIDPNRVAQPMIALSKAGVDVEAEELEAFLLAGGSLDEVADALISAEKADLDIDFRRLAAIHLAGRDVRDAVETRVNPKVLLCPPAKGRQGVISGVCQDGVRLGARARITVRTKLDRLVGGAGAETVVARVGEGIVAAIGRSPTHKHILESPEAISKYLLDHGLDSGTCFEILSVDISDVDVMDNVGAKLRTAQADTDKQIAQAHAEIRRAAAVAAHHEMVARTTDMRSRVVSAKSSLPLAAASAFRETNLGARQPLRASVNDHMRWKTGS